MFSDLIKYRGKIISAERVDEATGEVKKFVDISHFFNKIDNISTAAFNKINAEEHYAAIGYKYNPDSSFASVTDTVKTTVFKLK